jgi:Flp pilus assembly protein TadD
MLAFYVLVLPDRWFRWTAPALPARPWLAPVLVVGGAICAVICRFPHVIWIALAGLALPVTPRTQRAALAYAYAFALMLVVDRSTSITVDYYVRWGSAERRFGSLPTAETAYRTLAALEPDEERSHFQLGRVLLERGDTDAGLAELHTAQHLEPARVRAYLEEAHWLAAHGKRPAALDKAKEATYADPSNQEARDLVDTLSGKRPVPTPHAPADTDPP